MVIYDLSITNDLSREEMTSHNLLRIVSSVTSTGEKEPFHYLF